MAGIRSPKPRLILVGAAAIVLLQTAPLAPEDHHPSPSFRPENLGVEVPLVRSGVINWSLEVPPDLFSIPLLYELRLHLPLEVCAMLRGASAHRRSIQGPTAPNSLSVSPKGVASDTVFTVSRLPTIQAISLRRACSNAAKYPHKGQS